MLQTFPASTTKVLCIYPDWITASATSPDKRRDMEALGTALMKVEVAGGARIVPQTWMGFSGGRARDCFLGEKPEATIIRISGETAGQAWRDVARVAEKCSRLDLQVTARVLPTDRELAEKSYRLACAEAKRRGKELHISLIQSNYGGGTLYLGARSSELFGRLYDKAEESGSAEYADCWRWELETKGRRAWTYLQQLATSEHAESLISASVWDYFRDRGVLVPWDRADGDAVFPPPAVGTDDERRIMWLRETIGPIVSGLVQRGNVLDVLDALALDADELVRIAARPRPPTPGGTLRAYAHLGDELRR